MGTHKICAAVNKRAAHKDCPCDRLWGAVCGRFTSAKVCTQRGHLGGGEGQFRGSILVQDKVRGSRALPRTGHTAPQRGSVWGFSNFRADLSAGVTFGPLGSRRGLSYRRIPAVSPLSRGSWWGYGAQKSILQEDNHAQRKDQICAAD